MKQYLKKGIMYILGVMLIAFAIALNIEHQLGNGPFDQFNYALSEILNIDMGLVIIMVNMVFVCLYFIKHKNKDIWITIIAVLTLGTMFGFFSQTILSGMDLSNSNDPIVWIMRVLVFFVSLNILSIGVVMVLKSGLSILAFEQAITLVNGLKPFKKLNFGQARMIVDATLILLAIILSIIFLSGIVFYNYIATFATFLLGGPFINFYLKLYSKLFEKEEKESQL